MDQSARPIIYQELCTACGACIEVCPHHALLLADDTVILDTAIECEYCGACEEICPTEAIQRPFLVMFEEPAA